MICKATLRVALERELAYLAQGGIVQLAIMMGVTVGKHYQKARAC